MRLPMVHSHSQRPVCPSSSHSRSLSKQFDAKLKICSIWSQIPVKFPRSEVFQCHDCTKKQSFHQPIYTESTPTPPSLPRFHQPFSSIRWKAVRVASSQWKNSASASMFRANEQWNSEQQGCFCNMFSCKKKNVSKKGLWSSKFIEALDMPNSWGIPKGSERQRTKNVARDCNGF